MLKDLFLTMLCFVLEGDFERYVNLHLETSGRQKTKPSSYMI